MALCMSTKELYELLQVCREHYAKVSSFQDLLDTAPMPRAWASLLIAMPSTPSCLVNMWRFTVADAHLCLLQLDPKPNLIQSSDCAEVKHSTQPSPTQPDVDRYDALCRLMLQLDAEAASAWHVRLACSARELERCLEAAVEAPRKLERCLEAAVEAPRKESKDTHSAAHHANDAVVVDTAEGLMCREQEDAIGDADAADVRARSILCHLKQALSIFSNVFGTRGS